jgi:hypothetical protein
MDPQKIEHQFHSRRAPYKRVVILHDNAITTPRDPSSKSTPVRASKAVRGNVGAFVETHEVMDHLLNGELYDARFRGLKNFEDGKLTNAAIGFDPSNILAAIVNDEPALFPFDTTAMKRRWVGWPGLANLGNNSGANEAAIANCINGIGRVAARLLGKDDAPRSTATLQFQAMNANESQILFS